MTLTEQFEIAPCPVCKTNAHVGEADSDWECFVYCKGGCYDVDCVGDPAEFVPLSISGHGQTLADAVANWNEQAEQAA